MKRKEFINPSLGTLVVAIPAVTLLGCSSSNGGDKNPNPNPNPNPQANRLEDGTTDPFSTNREHSLTVSRKDAEGPGWKSPIPSRAVPPMAIV